MLMDAARPFPVTNPATVQVQDGAGWNLAGLSPTDPADRPVGHRRRAPSPLVIALLVGLVVVAVFLLFVLGVGDASAAGGCGGG